MMTSESSDSHILLDVYGQQPAFYKLYTQISFAFANHLGVPNEKVTSTLSQGLEKLTKAFPWLAGRVVPTKNARGGTIYMIRTPEAPSSETLFSVREYCNDHTKNIDALQQARWPMSMLDESWLCSRNTLGMIGEETEADVFLVQASYVTGGVIVSFVGQHNVMDMTGLAEFVRLFDKACSNEKLDEQDLATGNLLLSEHVPLFDEAWVPGADADRYIMKKDDVVTTKKDASVATEADAPHPPATHWAYFNFPADALCELKAEATKSKDSSVSYVTTDDALSALIWQSTCRARNTRMPSDWSSTLGRAVDGRTFVGMSSKHPGCVTNMAYHDSTFDELGQQSLGQTAGVLRKAVDPKTSRLSETTRAYATLLSRAEDKSTVSVTAQLDLSKDIALSSWSKYNLCNFNFGLSLGPPMAVFRPCFQPFEGLMYLMPKARDGSIAAAISLRDDDMASLKGDGYFRKFADYIG